MGGENLSNREEFAGRPKVTEQRQDLAARPARSAEGTDGPLPRPPPTSTLSACFGTAAIWSDCLRVNNRLNRLGGVPGVAAPGPLFLCWQPTVSGLPAGRWSERFDDSLAGPYCVAP